jgi:hypothetical protein
MDCLDCLLDSGRPTDTVGICTACGAGVCLDHAVIVEHPLTRTAVIMRDIPVEPPARLLRCPTCQAAHQAREGPSTDPPPAGRRSVAELRPVFGARRRSSGR